jgi:hypothetical protein
MHHHTHHPKRIAGWATQIGAPVLALGAGLTLLIGAAGVAGAATTASKASSTSTQRGGASGKVATLSAASMEVQNPTSGQTTVSWTTTTAFSRVVNETVSAISVGDCLTVTGTPSKKSKTTIAANSITIRTAPASGTCTAAGGRFGAGGPVGVFGRGAGGAGGAGFSGGARTFTRGGGPGGGGFPGARRLNFDLASGKVTAVSGSTLTLSGLIFNPTTRPKSTSSKGSKKPAKASNLITQKIKVTTSKSTTLSETQVAAASALAVGDCVTAFGQLASTGAVTAQSVSIDSTSAATCAGPGGFFSRSGGPGGGPPFSGQTTNG